MDSYEGPALLLADGRTLTVHASLAVDRSGRLKGWGGMLRPEPATQEGWHQAFDARGTEIEMPSGRLAAVLVMKDNPGEGLRILGSGGAPF